MIVILKVFEGQQPSKKVSQLTPKQRYLLGHEIGDRWKEVAAHAEIEESKVRRLAEGSKNPYELSSALVKWMSGAAFSMETLKDVLRDVGLGDLTEKAELGFTLDE